LALTEQPGKGLGGLLFPNRLSLPTDEKMLVPESGHGMEQK
jgi:hypothetical protein